MKLVCQCSHRVETHEITAGLKVKCHGQGCDCVCFEPRPASITKLVDGKYKDLKFRRPRPYDEEAGFA